jgi:hypothetical protein
MNKRSPAEELSVIGMGKHSKDGRRHGRKFRG